MSTATAPRLPRMSFEEFLAWADEDTYAEWVDGEVVMMSAASSRHQQIVVFLSTLLNLYVQARGLGTVLVAPFLMKLSGSAREPDILFIARDRTGTIRRTHLEGPADLVVEVVSPDSRTRDRREKLREYERAGIREYWLIDPEREKAEFYELKPSGEYAPIPVRQGRVESVLLVDLWLDVGWLWSNPPADAWGILKEWGLA